MPKILLIVVGAVLILGGCATTGDPRAGGLFGWSEDKAIERQSELETALDRDKRKHAENVAAQEGLKKTASAKASRNAAQQKQLNAMDKELAAMDKELAGVKAVSQEQQKRLASLRQKKAGLESQLAGLQNNSAPDADEAAEIARLKKEIDRLTQEALTLSEL